MSGDRQIDVRITAQVGDFNAAMTNARNQTVMTAAEFRKLETQTRSQASSWATLSPVMRNTANATQEVAQGFRKTGEAAAGMHGSISVATREFRALFDELTSGRTNYTPGTLAIIANRVFGLQAGALLAVGAVIALGAGLGYLAYQSIEAERSINSLKLAEEFTTGIKLTDEQLTGMVNTLGTVGATSRSAAREILGAFAQVKDSSTTLQEALAALSVTWEQRTQQDGEKVRAEWIKVFSDPIHSLDSFRKGLSGLTLEQNKMLDSVRGSTNANQVAAAMLSVLQSKVTALNATYIEEQIALEHAAPAVRAFDEAGRNQASTDELRRARAESLTRQFDNENTVLNSLIDTLRHMAESSAQAGTALSEAERRFGAHHQDIVETTKAIEQFQSKLKDPAVRSNADDLARYNDMLQNAQNHLHALTADHTGAAAAARRFGHDAVEQTREQIAETNATEQAGKAQQLQTAIDLWQKLIDGHKLTKQQIVQVETEKNQAIIALNRELASETRGIQKAELTGSIERDKLVLESKKAELQADYEANKISYQQKYELMVQFTRQAAAEDLKLLDAEIAMNENDKIAYARLVQQKMTLATRLNLDLARLDRQRVEDANRANQQELLGWKTMVGQLDSSFGQLTRDIFTSRKNLNQDLIKLGGDLIAKELELDFKYLVKHLLFSKTMLAADKTADEQGFLMHLLFGNKKAEADATTAAASSAQQAAAATLNIAAMKVQAGAEIPVDAALVFAGVFANLAPSMGPAAAGPAGAAQAAVLAQLAVASAAGGMWDTGHSNLVGMLHPRESVLPASIAGPMREFFTGGGQNKGSGGDKYDVHFHTIDGRTGIDFIRAHMGTIVAELSRQKRLGNKHLRND